ncbi:MAG: hypothetical protein ABJ013_02990 [Halioglobus sp.]
MHELVARISDPEKCYVFARNAIRKGHPELATQAYRRAVDLRAEQHDVATEAEHAAARAIFAYEEALSHAKGKRTRATGTWQLVNRHGLIAAISKRLSSRSNDETAAALKELGMEDYSFEAVRTSYPEAFEQQLAA